MGETSISWCHYTFNVWWGCFKISPGCTHCYAATFDRRVHGKDTQFWDRTGPRRFMSASYWKQPLKWNERAKAAGVRYRVFCGSMCDWAEIHPDPTVNALMDSFRARLFELIAATPHLDWLLLSKRIENVPRFLPWMQPAPYYQPPWPNVWIGTTVEDQERAAYRIPRLLEIPAVVRFLSCEPLLELLNLREWLWREHGLRQIGAPPGLRWLIAGAESGPKARPCHVDWLRSLRDQCQQADVPFLLKQAEHTPAVYISAATLAIGADDGSTIKGRGPAGGKIVELPYLDGIQHVAFPEVSHAA